MRCVCVCVCVCVRARVRTHRPLIEPLVVGKLRLLSLYGSRQWRGTHREAEGQGWVCSGGWGLWKRKLLKEATPKRPSHLETGLSDGGGWGVVSKHLSKVKPGEGRTAKG